MKKSTTTVRIPKGRIKKSHLKVGDWVRLRPDTEEIMKQLYTERPHYAFWSLGMSQIKQYLVNDNIHIVNTIFAQTDEVSLTTIYGKYTFPICCLIRSIDPGYLKPGNKVRVKRDFKKSEMPPCHELWGKVVEIKHFNGMKSLPSVGIDTSVYPGNLISNSVGQLYHLFIHELDPTYSKTK